jgi:hypothetical protein
MRSCPPRGSLRHLLWELEQTPKRRLPGLTERGVPHPGPQAWRRDPARPPVQYPSFALDKFCLTKNAHAGRQTLPPSIRFPRLAVSVSSGVSAWAAFTRTLFSQQLQKGNDTQKSPTMMCQGGWEVERQLKSLRPKWHDGRITSVHQACHHVYLKLSSLPSPLTAALLKPHHCILFYPTMLMLVDRPSRPPSVFRDWR